MKIHITNLHNIGGTATLAMDGVVQVAKELDFTEIGVMKSQFYEDYWNTISHHLDGTIASLYHGDIVFFQYPTWNGPDYDRMFVEKIKMYNETRLVIFVHDMQKLMFNSDGFAKMAVNGEVSMISVGVGDSRIYDSVKNSAVSYVNVYKILQDMIDDVDGLYEIGDEESELSGNNSYAALYSRNYDALSKALEESREKTKEALNVLDEYELLYG